MLVLPPRSIARLAERIERAYRIRQPILARDAGDAGVWSAAAAMLLDLHRSDPLLPLDPELYVAAQAPLPGDVELWSELVSTGAAERYSHLVRRIIKQLRTEIEKEVRRAEKRLRSGEPIESVMSTSDPGLSPIGRYIIARRAHRSDLTDAERHRIREQHQACPLYREAVSRLIRAEDYPVFDVLMDGTCCSESPGSVLSFSVN